MLCRDLDDLESDLIDAVAAQTITAAAEAIADTIYRQLAKEDQFQFRSRPIGRCSW